MLKTKADSGARLLRAAEKTTYLYGFGSASIADIAEEAGFLWATSTTTSRPRTRLAAPSLSCAFRDSRTCCRTSVKQAPPRSASADL